MLTNHVLVKLSHFSFLRRPSGSSIQKGTSNPQKWIIPFVLFEHASQSGKGAISNWQCYYKSISFACKNPNGKVKEIFIRKVFFSRDAVGKANMREKWKSPWETIRRTQMVNPINWLIVSSLHFLETKVHFRLLIDVLSLLTQGSRGGHLLPLARFLSRAKLNSKWFGEPFVIKSIIIKTINRLFRVIFPR